MLVVKMNIKIRHSGSIIQESGIISAFLLIAVVLFFTGCDKKGTIDPVSEEAFLQEIDAFVTERMNPDGSGYGILVVQDGEIIFGKGWGMANIADGFPFTPDTPIDLASLTKQFTAVAILMLYERDSLDLDMKIVDHFPEFPAAWSEVTVHHLLTHQSGIPNYTEFVPENEAGYDGLTNQMALELVLQNSSVEFPPGEQTRYSNTGYLILAMLVEKISKMSYSDFLEETIFGPLNMLSTFVHDETSVRPPNSALPYDENNGLYDYEWYSYGAGGIYSTLNDMFKWDQALYTDHIISQATLQLATTGYTGGENNYGYGWMVGSHGGYPSYRHGGFGLGVLNYIYRVPDRNFMYLMLSNGGVFANDGFDTWTNELKDRIFAHYLL
jgi:CubicO group peptidase (beta-lactamase class C family)